MCTSISKPRRYPDDSAFVRATINVAERAQSDGQALFDSLVAMWLTFQDVNEEPDARIPENYMTESEQLQHTFFFNLIGRAEARGKLSLNGSNKLQLDFEDGPLRQDPVYGQIEEIVQTMATAMKGKYIRFPFWGNGKILDNSSFRRGSSSQCTRWAAA